MNQPLTALARAQQIRTAYQALRRELASLPYPEGRAQVAALLREPTETVARMRVHYLLTSIRSVGDYGARRLINEAGFSPSAWTRRVGPMDSEPTLSERQREALASVVEKPAAERYERRAA